jgi:FkbM family methyltransferase
MSALLSQVFQYLFVRKRFYRFHRKLVLLGLNGMGICISKNRVVTGEESFLNNLFRNSKNAVVFDIGAHTGEYSKRVLDIIPTATVYAFEPHPIPFSKLKEAASAFSFKAFNVGCGNREGLARLYDYKYNDGSRHASLFKDVIEIVHKKEAKSHTVKIIKLDDFVVNNEIEAIDLLKIDTEGNELNILQGLECFIMADRVKVIHFEFNEMNIISRIFFKDFYDLLMNYDLFRMLPDGLVPIREYNPLLSEFFGFQNIVAINKQRYQVDGKADKPASVK